MQTITLKDIIDICKYKFSAEQSNTIGPYKTSLYHIPRSARTRARRCDEQGPGKAQNRARVLASAQGDKNGGLARAWGTVRVSGVLGRVKGGLLCFHSKGKGNTHGSKGG